jgi:hypothetical protein
MATKVPTARFTEVFGLNNLSIATEEREREDQSCTTKVEISTFRDGTIPEYRGGIHQ